MSSVENHTDYLHLIRATFDAPDAQRCIPRTSLSQKIDGLDDYLDRFLLFNPHLTYWLTYDEAQIVKTDVAPRTLVCNVATTLVGRIEKQQIATLLKLTALPASFARAEKKPLWDRVNCQLQILIALVESDQRPAWLDLLLATPEWILCVIHSLLYMPANRDYPIWQPDYGALLAAKDKPVYQGIGEDTEAWHDALVFFLVHRKALWRYHLGTGSAMRANRVLERMSRHPFLGQAQRQLTAARLLAEYLDTASEVGDKPYDALPHFADLWNTLQHQKNLVLSDDTALRKSRLDKESKTVLEPPPAYVEFINYHALKNLCRQEDLLPQYFYFLNNLFSYIAVLEGTYPGKPFWVLFNIEEIQKRKTFFLKALEEVTAATRYDDLIPKISRVDLDVFLNNTVMTVEPGNRWTLKNRLPEITDDQLNSIEAGAYKATVIFDTMIAEPLRRMTPTDTLWVPRVYRILDSIAALDPEHIQEILLSFDTEAGLEERTFYLPLPTDTDAGAQRERMNLVARFILITIFNHAMSLGVKKASVDLSPLREDRRCFGFTHHGLQTKLLDYAHAYGYTSYANFVEKFNYQAFSLKAANKLPPSVSFTTQDMTQGHFAGIDIGGTAIKICLFSKDNPFTAYPVSSFDTFTEAETKDRDTKVPVEVFCDRVLDYVETYLEDKCAFKDLNGIGISWPGAVRNSKIVGFSRTLGKLIFQQNGEARSLNFDCLPQDLQAVDLVATFFERLRKRHDDIAPAFTVTMENDGNAEAYGNYCVLKRHGSQRSGGKIIIKLGTSLAGGHIDAYGAVSPHVAEFSKMILDFNVPPRPSSEMEGLARHFVSSQGVRNLSRSFTFNGAPLFGDLSGENVKDTSKTRVEAIELGELLDFWHAVDDDPLAENRLLQEFTGTDNQEGQIQYWSLVEKLEKALDDEDSVVYGLLKKYILARGIERYAALTNQSKYDIKVRVRDANLRETWTTPAGDTIPWDTVWNLGAERTSLLLGASAFPFGVVPATMNSRKMAEKILGTVALFSQLGLHIAHLVIALYNVYKRGRFTEIILAGGVLSGRTGPLVKQQTEAFLLKYYDKVYGPTKNLKPGAIKLAPAEDGAIMGPLGAAMIANRQQKMNALAQMHQHIDYLVRSIRPGQALPPAEKILRGLNSPRLEAADVTTYLDALVAKALLLPRDEDQRTYIKSLSL